MKDVFHPQLWRLDTGPVCCTNCDRKGQEVCTLNKIKTERRHYVNSEQRMQPIRCWVSLVDWGRLQQNLKRRPCCLPRFPLIVLVAPCLAEYGFITEAPSMFPTCLVSESWIMSSVVHDFFSRVWFMCNLILALSDLPDRLLQQEVMWPNGTQWLTRLLRKRKLTVYSLPVFNRGIAWLYYATQKNVTTSLPLNCWINHSTFTEPYERADVVISLALSLQWT